MCWLCERTKGWAHLETCTEYKHKQRKGGICRGNKIGHYCDYFINDNAPLYYHFSVPIIYFIYGKKATYEQKKICDKCIKDRVCISCSGTGKMWDGKPGGKGIVSCELCKNVGRL